MSTDSSRTSSRILTIHSHIVRGYFGNRAIVFSLQLLGHYVDFINSVQFTSLFIKEGLVLSDSDLERMLKTFTQGPEVPVKYQYMITGYIGSGMNLRKFIDFAKQQRKIRGESIQSLDSMLRKGIPVWLCDPVMGDNNICYVPVELKDIYKDEAIPLADIITPNQSEIGWLCDRTVESLPDAIECCINLHDRGVPVVILTSMRSPGSNELILLASERDGTDERRFVIRIPFLDVYLVGAGDLFSAMLVDGLHRFKRLDSACERAVAVLHVSSLS